LSKRPWLEAGGFFAAICRSGASSVASGAQRLIKPVTIDVIVAGGDATPMMQAWHMYRPQTVSIDEWR
jgi:hypothetical protein